MANRWHADPIYKHEPTAMLVFRLLAMLCLNVFPAGYRRNLKPALRRSAGHLENASQIAAERYVRIRGGRVLAPTSRQPSRETPATPSFS